MNRAVIFASLFICVFWQAHAQTYKVLYNFGSAPNDGTYPRGVIADGEGNFYGLASGGGTCRDIIPPNGECSITVVLVPTLFCKTMLLVENRHLQH